MTRKDARALQTAAKRVEEVRTVFIAMETPSQAIAYRYLMAVRDHGEVVHRLLDEQFAAERDREKE